jgi:ABC-type uncharacterized transport system permease subunit
MDPGAAWLLTAPEGGLLYIAFGVFAGAAIVGFRALRGSRLERGLRPMLLVGTLSLTILTAAIAIREGLPPVVRRYEMLIGAAWLVSALPWVLLRRWPEPVVAAVCAPVLALLCLFAILLVPAGPVVPRGSGDIYLFLHIAMAAVGCAAFTFAAAMGGLYLWQIREMKRNPTAALGRRVPPLEALDRVNFLAVVVGFPFFALGVLSGWLRVGQSGHTFREWVRDPTVLATLTGFLVYLLLFLSRGLFAWRGRRIAWFTVLGFFVVVVGFVVAAFCPSPAVVHPS